MNQTNGEVVEEAPAPQGLMDGVKANDVPSDESSETEVSPHKAAETVVEPAKEEEEKLERPEFFPEKFWAEDGPDLEKLVNSYQELEKKFSQGKHKAPSEYKTDILNEAFEDDDPLLLSYTDWSKKHGISQAAFEEMAQSFKDIIGQNAEKMEFDYQKEIKALGPNAEAVIQSTANWADSLERKGILAKEERELLNSFGGTALGQRVLQKFRNMSGDMSSIPTVAVAEDAMSEEEFNSEIQTMMNDPRYKTDMGYANSVAKKIYHRAGEKFPS